METIYNIPIQKSNHPKILNDYRPVALTYEVLWKTD